MSAAKHTPGPWQQSGVRQKLGNEDCIRVGPDGFAVAFLPIGRRPHEQAGAIADARLIAAAPELLEACVAYFADRAAAGCTAETAAVKRMRAAMAKAGGAA